MFPPNRLHSKYKPVPCKIQPQLNSSRIIAPNIQTACPHIAEVVPPREHRTEAMSSGPDVPTPPLWQRAKKTPLVSPTHPGPRASKWDGVLQSRKRGGVADA